MRHSDDAAARLLTFSGDPVALVDTATATDPGLVMRHVLKGLLCLLGAEKSLLPDARAARAGGSHAQRELIAQTLASAAELAGQRPLARALLNERLAIKPRSALNMAWSRRIASA